MAFSLADLSSWLDFRDLQRFQDTIMERGFSLFELLVVLVLISIFSAFVGINVAGSLSNMELKTATKEVAAALRYARNRAVTESVPYVALLDFNQSRLTIKPDPNSPNKEKKKAGALEVRKTYTLPEDVRFINALTYDGGESDSRFFAVVFMPNGCSSGGTVLLGNDRRKKSVLKIDFITGTVRVELS